MLRYDPDRDAYAILGVDSSASQEVIEKAFRKAALLWHPDKSRAPDAADRFHEVQKAGEALRDPVARREYDRMRGNHFGTRGPPRSTFRKPEPQPATPYAPMRPPPDWLSDRVKVHHDAVLFMLEHPREHAAGVTAANLAAAVALGAAMTSGEVSLAALAVVLWAIGRVLLQPPHKGRLSWAKIAPGRQVAELHALDESSHRYQKHDVPFGQLVVAVVQRGATWRIEIRGFPRESVPVLLSTRDRDEATRRAREAGKWLQLPLAA